MAQAQLIQGTGAELIAHLEKRREQPDLLLIIPEEAPPSEASTLPIEAENHQQGKIFLRDGIPTFATQGATQPVTTELVKRLLDED